MNEFPHSRMFDSDLREIVDAYCKLKDLPKNLDELTNYLSNHINDYISNNVDDILSNFAVEKRVIYIGDSYIQGIGGNGEDIQKEVKNLIGGEFYSFYSGGSGFIRRGERNENFLDCLTRAITNVDKRESITDIVFSGGYNELGIIPLPTVTDFTNAMQACFNTARSAFPNATIRVVAFPWVTGVYNNDYKTVQRRLIEAATICGVNVTHYAINWLYKMSAEYESGDGVHPSALGYKQLALYYAQFINGADPSRQATIIGDFPIDGYEGAHIDVVATLNNDLWSIQILLFSGDTPLPGGLKIINFTPFKYTVQISGVVSHDGKNAETEAVFICYGNDGNWLLRHGLAANGNVYCNVTIGI